MMKKYLLFGLVAFCLQACFEPVVETPSRGLSERPLGEAPLRTYEGVVSLDNIAITSTDALEYMAVVKYSFVVKSDPKPKHYADRELQNIVRTATVDVLSVYASEALTEDNFKKLRGEIFRKVNETIDPLKVDVSYVELMELKRQER